MGITEKCAYIKGLMEGLELDTTSKEGKVLAAIVDLLEEVCDEVKSLDDNMDQIYDELDAMDEDMDDLEAAVYGDDEEEDEDGDEEGEAEYELTCPKCGAVTVVDEATLLDENSEISCQNCGAAFDIEFGTEEEETPEEEE